MKLFSGSKIYNKKGLKPLLQALKKGQVTIFFGVAMTILITITAFVINVGMYVKARINLQNAVDAAAWSGAAVQARQLTNIAYLNWEMRNVYKEWMFKYYVLGQIGLSRITTIAGQSDSDQTNFRMKSFNNDPASGVDGYNVPSVCIHFAGTHNICDIYSIPGLPRFANNGLGGIDDTFNTLLDSIVEEKAKNCSFRSEINYQVANAWAYGIPRVGSPGPASGGIPQIAVDRPGAWPEALNLAIRIRNLEAMVNHPPQAGVSIDTGTFDSNNPAFERTTKAFFSAYRNLGGPDNFLRSNFVLTELPPKVVNISSNSLSYILIPEDKRYDKYYLDLRLQMLNLTTFFTSFMTTTDDSGTTASEAACSASKIAIPVPSYPFGFEKNSKVLTYYAVKGETKFIGLFNPFTSALDGMRITAYAAAKPFGGRIGPKLFGIQNESEVVPRGEGAELAASYPYFGVFTDSTATYTAGSALPMSSSDFWAVASGTSTPIGGNPIAGNPVKYGVPNLLYDIAGDMESHKGGSLGSVVQPLDTPTTSDPTNRGGLMSVAQMKKFVGDNIDLSGSLSAGIVSRAIEAARAPTNYEAGNYLIPSVENQRDGKLSDTVPAIDKTKIIHRTGSPKDATVYEWHIFAPIYCPGAWTGSCVFYDLAEIENYLERIYMSYAEAAVSAFTDSMKNAAETIRKQGDDLGSTSGGDVYLEAADVIHDGPPLSCKSISGLFKKYYLGARATDVPSDPAHCTTAPDSSVVTSLVESIMVFWRFRFNTPTTSQTYVGKFALRDNEADARHFTAYKPGKRHGANADTGPGAGITRHPFASSMTNPPAATLTKRNFYSTKFVALKDLASEGFAGPATSYAEENVGPNSCGSSSLVNKCVENTLDGVDIGGLVH